MSNKESIEALEIQGMIASLSFRMCQQIEVRKAKKFLMAYNNAHGITITTSMFVGYYSFVRRLYVDVQKRDLPLATSNAAARRDLMITQGFDSNALAGLALLQGVTLP
jgi:hypothetical protein